MIRAVLLSLLISQTPHDTVYAEFSKRELVYIRDALNYYYKHETKECGEINFPEVIIHSRLLKRLDNYLEPQKCTCEPNGNVH